MPSKYGLNVDVPGEAVANKGVKAGFTDGLLGAEAVVKSKVKQACKVSRWWQINAKVMAKRVDKAVKEGESKRRRE